MMGPKPLTRSMYSLPSISQRREPFERSVTIGQIISFHWGRKPDKARGSANDLRYSCVKLFDLAVRRVTRSIKTLRCFSCCSVKFFDTPVCGGLYGPNGLISSPIGFVLAGRGPGHSPVSGPAGVARV